MGALDLGGRRSAWGRRRGRPPSGSGTAWPRPRPGPPGTARRRIGGPCRRGGPGRGRVSGAAHAISRACDAQSRRAACRASPSPRPRGRAGREDGREGEPALTGRACRSDPPAGPARAEPPRSPGRAGPGRARSGGHGGCRGHPQQAGRPGRAGPAAAHRTGHGRATRRRPSPVAERLEGRVHARRAQGAAARGPWAGRRGTAVGVPRLNASGELPPSSPLARVPLLQGPQTHTVSAAWAGSGWWSADPDAARARGASA